ncbi:MAG: VOC family protein [Acidimicrobiales bacterium]
MSPSRTYPPGVPCWIDLEPADTDAAVDFYTALFGWRFDDAAPPGSPEFYLIASLDGADVAAIGPHRGESGWNTYVAVESADEAAERVAGAGGRVETGPHDAGPGGRWAGCTDPDGASFRLWEARRRPGAQAVNVPAAWNFSDLHTHDPDGAEAFYADLFGWVGAPMAEGGTMVRVPGYGDHLAATSDPGIHERQVHTPPGFADVVGAIVPAGPGEDPHWHVTFTVADRDAVAEAAHRLGGTVLAVDDAPWSRQATLRGPTGEVFTVSQFTPAAVV